MPDAVVLHARVGRVTPNPVSRTLDELADAPRARGWAPRAWRTWCALLPRVWWLLGWLLAALWPHGLWLARRFTDGSDEPWGLLEEAGIQPNGEHAMEPIEQAVAAVYREMAEAGLLDVAVQRLDRASA